MIIDIMRMRFKYILLSTICLSGLLFCNENNYFITNSLKTRSIAQGGAYLSIKDNIFALNHNPAAFSVAPVMGEKNVSFFLNPSAIPVIISNLKDFKSFDVPLGLLVQGLGIFYKKINIGVLIGDETLTNIPRLKNKKMTELAGYRSNRKSSLCLSLELAPQVSIGIAGDCFNRSIDNEQLIEFGYRYGVWIKTLKGICIGLCYIDLPKQLKEDRLELDRFDDETLNVGFSYSPWDFLQIALDIRNVSEDNRSATGEPHMGINLIPWKHIAFQGGFFKEKNNIKVVSFGCALLNEDYILSEEKKFDHNEFILNAAFVWKKGPIFSDRWFMLSSVIRI